MSEPVVLVLDCGATNLRAIAVDINGKVVARASEPNTTVPDPDRPDWHDWPLESIIDKLARSARQVTAEIGANRVRAVTVTTFGVDGTLLDADEKPLCPVISWKCPRTQDAQRHMARYIDPDEAVRITGVGHFAFNTLNKFIWFRENRPELLAKARHFLFISSLITHRLTGRLTNDATMVGTSQMAELRTQSFSEAILTALDVDKSLFAETVFPGEVIAPLLPDAADALGLPSGVPVVSAGHDTQFAIFGAGATRNQPVLSSGTWEILMARSDSIDLLRVGASAASFTCEWDVLKGHYNPGVQYLASAVVEWIGRTMFGEIAGAERYRTMIDEAEAAGPNPLGIAVDPDFLEGGGAITGLSLDVGRGAIFRAALEGLVARLKTGLSVLENAGGFTAEALTLVGGGARNPLWTQMKADALGIPIRTLDEAETTVLGAAMFAMAGAGLYPSAEDARAAFDLTYATVTPGKPNDTTI